MEHSLRHYLSAWEAWCDQATIEAIKLAPSTHFGWKVADEASLIQQLNELMPISHEVHVGTVDNRKIALFALNTPILGIPIAQIMQRRARSTDQLGLDHVAFWCSDSEALKRSLANTNYQWDEQSNEGHSWISLRFDKQHLEAKFFDHTSLDIGSRELAETSKQLKARWSESS